MMALGLRDEKDIPQDKARKDIPSKRRVRAKPGEYALNMHSLPEQGESTVGKIGRREQTCKLLWASFKKKKKNFHEPLQYFFPM